MYHQWQPYLFLAPWIPTQGHIDHSKMFRSHRKILAKRHTIPQSWSDFEPRVLLVYAVRTGCCCRTRTKVRRYFFRLKLSRLIKRLIPLRPRNTWQLTYPHHESISFIFLHRVDARPSLSLPIHFIDSEVACHDMYQL